MAPTADFDQLIQSNDVVAFVFFRGAWCPWCRAYLSDLNKTLLPVLKQHNAALYGVSSESDSITATIKDDFKIDYEIVNDVSTEFAKRFNVHVTPKDTSPRAGDPDAYPNGVIQPAVVMFHKGELFFNWVLEPSKANLGGAKDRVMPDDLVKVLEARLKGEDVQSVPLRTYGGQELKTNYPGLYSAVSDYYRANMPEALALI
eukprot:TRINITY_DN10852_c0_g2_i2.p2 TRINITY_DN10852_c0_g2~~TRINITY_DN10852_c0_g2_i2.p2  ORF type:complete len:202 (+),score=42.39 TRINITY_DN10852_c0_g2_i2:1127-1732(+)